MVVIGDGNAHRRYEWLPCGNRGQPASGSAQEHQKRGYDGRQVILQPARRAAADQVAHDEPEIEAASMNQQALEDIRVAAQMRATHPTGVMRCAKERSIRSPLTHQAPAARATNPPPLGRHRELGLRLLRPIAATTVRLRHVRPETYGHSRVDHRLIAVIPLVRDDLVERLRLSHVGLRIFKSAPAAAMAVSMIVVVSPIVGVLQGDGDQGSFCRSTACSALWVRCVRPSFIFAIFASGSHGIFPIFVRGFLLALAVQRAKSSRVGVSIPDACASPVKNS